MISWNRSSPPIPALLMTMSSVPNSLLTSTKAARITKIYKEPNNFIENLNSFTPETVVWRDITLEWFQVGRAITSERLSITNQDFGSGIVQSLSKCQPETSCSSRNKTDFIRQRHFIREIDRWTVKTKLLSYRHECMFDLPEPAFEYRYFTRDFQITSSCSDLLNSAFFTGLLERKEWRKILAKTVGKKWKGHRIMWARASVWKF